MSVVKDYIWLPLQRKMFKNFGHYDYSTQTFELNAGRINEVLLDPTFDPFLDILRQASISPPHYGGNSSAPHCGGDGDGADDEAEMEAEAPLGLSPSSAASMKGPVHGEPAASPSAAIDMAASTATTAGGSETAKGSLRGVQPVCQLLKGSIRAPGFLSFMKQLTGKKALAIQSVDLVVDLLGCGDDDGGGSATPSTFHQRRPEDGGGTANLPAAVEVEEGARVSVSPHLQREDARDIKVDAPQNSGRRSVSPGGASRPPLLDGNSACGTPLPSQRDAPKRYQGSLTRLSSHQLLGTLASEVAALNDSREQGPNSLDDAGTRTPTHADSAPSPTSVTPTGGELRVIGKLIRLLRQHLQNTAVSASTVRITLCLPPDGATSSTVSRLAGAASQTSDEGPARCSTSEKALPWLRAGTRVIHVLCATGLRFSIDQSSATSEAIECSMALGDLQCYLHCMPADGPVPTSFSLDELIVAATDPLPKTSLSTMASTTPDTPSPSPPLSAKLSLIPSASGRLPPLTSANTPALLPTAEKLIIEADAAGGWCILLDPQQLSHLVQAGRSLSRRTAAMPGEASTSTLATFSANEAEAAASQLPEALPPQPQETMSVGSNPAIFSSDERPCSKKYWCIHGARCSVTLLTQSVVTAGVVAWAWRRALPPYQVSLLGAECPSAEKVSVENQMGCAAAGAAPSLSAPPRRPPVHELLAAPHITYAMQDVDLLFPSIDTESTPAFAGQRKKKGIYKNMYRNRLADVQITETMERHGSSGSSVFLGVGSISLLEYRHSSGDGFRVPPQEQQPMPLKTSSEDAATAPQWVGRSYPTTTILGATRAPYALVLLSRSTGLVRDETPPLPSSTTSPPARWSIQDELVMVGLAPFHIQLDLGFLEAMTSYAKVVERYLPGRGQGYPRPSRSAVAREVRSSELPYSVKDDCIDDGLVGRRSSLKVLVERADASVRFAFRSDCTTSVPQNEAEIGHAGSHASDHCRPHGPLLTRLLQRLGEQSRAHYKATLSSSTLPRQPKSDEARDDVDVTGIAELLAFPSDDAARFYAETLMFSLRDLQVVREFPAATAEEMESDEMAAPPSHSGASTSLKWREAVVYLQDRVTSTTTELLRSDNCPAMHVTVAHVNLLRRCGPLLRPKDVSASATGRKTAPPSLSMGNTPLHALRRVLALDMRLGDITTGVLTQDDSLLALHFVEQLLNCVTRCRQTRCVGDSSYMEDTCDSQSPSPSPCSSSESNVGLETGLHRHLHRRGVSHAPSTAMLDNLLGGYGGMLDSSGAIAGGDSLADIFAVTSGLERHTTTATDSSPLADVSSLWATPQTTCTYAEIRIGQVRLGFFAPRLSPMGEALGEPLFRCLPLAQRQAVDRSLLYHTYTADITRISAGLLVGDGALTGRGRESHVWLRVRACSVHEQFAPGSSGVAGPIGGVVSPAGPGSWAAPSLARGATKRCYSGAGVGGASASAVRLLQSYADGDASHHGQASDGNLGSEEQLLGCWEDSSEEDELSSASGVKQERGELRHGSAVCEIRFMSRTTSLPSASGAMLGGRDAEGEVHRLKIRLQSLGIHHAAAHNGDHFVSVMKNYFSDNSSAARESPSQIPAPAPESAGPVPQSRMNVRIELRNVMWTYRPLGIGRALVVILLPSATAHLELPPRVPDEKMAAPPSPPSPSAPPATAELHAWLRRPLTCYLCNDCDVDVLVREVLDPTTSPDWGADLEAAGFVRLGEVSSTVAQKERCNEHRVAPSPSRPQWLAQQSAANLHVRLCSSTSSTSSAILASDEVADQQSGSAVGTKGETASTRKTEPPPTSVRMKHLEASAFMAKDSFEAVTTVLEEWSSGQDLLFVDPPHALVMRSGPGFSWVAEEVARRCAPMTFQLHQERPPNVPSVLQPKHAVENFDGHGSFASSYAATAATTNTYGYARWRDTLAASKGHDQRSYEAYVAKVSALLDGPAWREVAAPQGSSSTASGQCSAASLAGQNSVGLKGLFREVSLTPNTMLCGPNAVDTTNDERSKRWSSPYRSHSRSSSDASDFSILSDLEIVNSTLRWSVAPDWLLKQPDNACTSFSAGTAEDGAGKTCPPFDLAVACEQQPHAISCWHRIHSVKDVVFDLNNLAGTDDALLHDTTGASPYFYPPVQLNFFLYDCSANVSLYEGTDLMEAALRKQRRGYLQIVSRGAKVATAAATRVRSQGAAVSPPTSVLLSAVEEEQLAALYGFELLPRHSHRMPYGIEPVPGSLQPPSAADEPSTERLMQLNEAGCRSGGFGDRDAEKRLVLCCRGITVQLNTFPPGSEEDLWFHVGIREGTVYDCIDRSDVHKLLTATLDAREHRAALPEQIRAAGRFLELTGLLSSTKNVYHSGAVAAATLQRHAMSVQLPQVAQQGGTELSIAVRLQPLSLTWSGASVDFILAFFGPSASSAGNAATATPSQRSVSSLRPTTIPSTASPGGVNAASTLMEAPSLHYRRVVILPTTITMAGSFDSEKGVLSALAEGSSIDALRSIPILSWIKLHDLPLPIPRITIDHCSSIPVLVQRIVEDTNCVSVRFLLTACCCGLQPLSAATKVGEAAKGLLLLPLSDYRGAALQHAVRTASAVLMQELVTQSSAMAALLTTGSYHASRVLLDLLVPPEHSSVFVAGPSRALQPSGIMEGLRQGQMQLRSSLQDSLTIASYCAGPDGNLLQIPAAALRLLMGVSGAATTTLWGIRNSQTDAIRQKEKNLYKK